MSINDLNTSVLQHLSPEAQAAAIRAMETKEISTTIFAIVAFISIVVFIYPLVKK